MSLVAAGPLGVVPARALFAAGVQVDLHSVGGSPELSDNAPALRRAFDRLAAAGGGELVLERGEYRVDSASLGEAGLKLPSNVRVRGAGRERTAIVVTGKRACNLFVALNRGGIAFQDLSLRGNGVVPGGGSPYGRGIAIRWMLLPTATVDVNGFSLLRVHLENFAGPYWVEIENLAAGGASMRDVRLEDVSFTSRPGNSPAPADVRVNSAAICMSGTHGPIQDVRVVRLSGDARHIKSGLILYHAVRGARVEAPRIDFAGVDGAADDGGAYALQLYDDGYRLSDIVVDDPVIRSPRSVGIYVAGGRDVAILNPRISGQTDPRAETLPKGAIVFNGTRAWRVSGGELRDNWCDLGISPPAHGTVEDPVLIGGMVSGVTAEGSENGVLVSYYQGSVGRGITLANCRWKTRGRTMLIQNGGSAVVQESDRASGYINDVMIHDCVLEADEGHRALDLWGSSGSPASGYIVSRSTLTGSNPLYARQFQGTLRIAGCLLADRGDSQGVAAATLIDCPKLDLTDLTLRSPGRGGIGIDLAASTGTVSGLRFDRCAHNLPPRAGPAQLGRAVPAFAGRRGQYVQNLEPAPGEPTGWVCDGGTRWRPAGTP